MNDQIQILTSVPFDVLVKAISRELEPIIARVISESLPDDLITSKEAGEIMNVSPATICTWVKLGVIRNFSTGNQRPVLSRREIIAMKKQTINGRLKRKEYHHE